MTSLLISLDRLARRVVQAEDAEACGHIAGELLLPAALHLRLDRHCLQRLDARHALNEEGLILGAAIELLVEAPAEQRRRARGDADVERERCQDDERQRHRVVEHHRQEDEREQEVDAECERRARQELADVLEFAHARHRIADASRLEIGDRQRHQVAEQPGAELHVDAVRRVREHIGAQRAEHSLEQGQRDQADDQNIERAHASMHEHLVDDHLEEQRGYDAKDLKEERCEQHLAQKPAVLVDRAEKPGDVESSREIRQTRAAPSRPGRRPRWPRVRPASSSPVAQSSGAGRAACRRRACRESGTRRPATRRSPAAG